MITSLNFEVEVEVNVDDQGHEWSRCRLPSSLSAPSLCLRAWQIPESQLLASNAMNIPHCITNSFILPDLDTNPVIKF
jgi:hypothetical protein